MFTESDDGTGAIGMIPIPDEARSGSLTPPANGGPTYPQYCTLDGILPGIEAFTNGIISKIAQNITDEIELTQVDTEGAKKILYALDSDVRQIKEVSQNSSLCDDINRILDSKLGEQKQALTASEAQLQKLNSLLSSLDDTYKSCFKQSYQDPHSDATIERFGIIPSTDHVDLNLTTLKLHPLEYVLYELAQNYFTRTPSETTPSKQIALLDIFVREDNGCIKEDEKHPGFPETHTIVLWKPAETTYIIDPSQRSFSEFLTNALSTTTLPLKCAFKENYFYSKKYIPLGYIKQYTAIGSEDGNSKETGRDCINISLQIGFELAAATISPENTYRMILDQLYQKLSNDTQNDKLNHKALRSIPAIHSSNSHTRKNADEILTQAESFLNDAGFKIVKTGTKK